MLDYVIVRINEKLIPEFQINYNAQNYIAQSFGISSWSQIKLESHQQLILILPAVLVFSKEVKIPSKNDEVIKQSLPYTLEENLSTEIEDNHFAYNQSGENLFNVCVVAKEVMQEINLQLEKNQLDCKKLYSETFSLPASSEILSILSIDNYFVVNNNNSGTRLSIELINYYIKQLVTKKIHVYTDKPLSLDSGIIEYKQVDTTLFQAKILLNNRVVNLFQGSYDKKTDKQNKIMPWKKSLAIVAFLLVSWLVINIFQFLSVSQKIDKINNKQHDLLIKLIPTASQSEINDPYSAIQSRLKYVETNKSSSSNGFTQSLLFVGQTLIKHPTIKIVSIRQRDNKLEIKIHAPNVNKLNQFQASLEAIALARHVKTGTRESIKDGISSVVTMEKF
jgi:general secretion pathway protein L